MKTLKGHIQGGQIHIDDSLPTDWPEGATVLLTLNPEDANDIDITGDSPEAIAAWMKWYEKFRELPRDQSDAEEIQRIIAEARAEQSKHFGDHAKRIEGLFS